MLYKLAQVDQVVIDCTYYSQQEGFKPKKYFSIDRVFRNEAMDATHLAEFHQIEGVVADYNLNLGNLMGISKSSLEDLVIYFFSFIYYFKESKT